MLIFASLRSLIPKVDGSVVTDNWVFRLHYKVSVIFLVAFTILATSREYFGEPITCHYTYDKPPLTFINQYCWVQSTFSIPDFWNRTVGQVVVYPGVASKTLEVQSRTSSPRVYHNYYQWVVVMLCLQAVLFYIPRYLWKMWERGKTRMLLQDLRNPVMKEEDKKQQLDLLLMYFVNNLRVHNSYVFRYFFCELLNLFNVVGQIYLIDAFLGGEFTQYGVEVFSFLDMDQKTRVDPMVKVFPRMTKCTFYDFGPSADIQAKDALCLLPLNIINEKIFVFMWLWFCILTPVTGFAILYRFLVLLFPNLRAFVIRMRSPLVSGDVAEDVVSKLQVGDWFVLYQLSKNMDAAIFRDLADIMATKLEPEEDDKNDQGINICNSKKKFRIVCI